MDYIPRFTVEVRRRGNGDDQPTAVIVTPLVRYSNHLVPSDQWIAAAHHEMQTRLHTVIGAYTGWSEAAMGFNVTGYLQLNNLTDSKYAHEPDVRLRNLTVHAFENLFDRAITQYGYGINGNQVAWTYWITAGSLYLGGGGGTVKRTEGLYLDTCKEIMDVSCAALAISYWMIMNSDRPRYQGVKHNIRRKTNQEFWIEEATNLQLDMGWGKTTTIDQVLKVVDRFYPTYRIVVMNPVVNSSAVNSRNGPDYDAEADFLFKKIIYLYYDYQNYHFCAVKKPQQFIREFKKNTRLEWCHDCTSYKCCCDDVEKKRESRKRKSRPCPRCKEETYSLKQHECGYKRCTDCYRDYKMGEEMDEHRCPISLPLNSIPVDFLDMENKKRPELWAYDFESRIVQCGEDESSAKFFVDSDGKYCTDENGETRIVGYEGAHKQVVNFIAYENVFTGEKRETESLEEFLNDALFRINDGNNIFAAHNASGYDARLLFDQISLMVDTVRDEPCVIARGSKILRMSVGKTRFIDSMLHLTGSLKGLAKDYLAGEDGVQTMMKGFFPHLFNRLENRNYIGNTPDISHYDLTSICNSEKDMRDFMEYYAGIRDKTDWDFWGELTKYCRLDVSILARIMRKHHDTCVEYTKKLDQRIGVSPWHSTTAAGYVHRMSLYHLEVVEGVEEGERAGGDHRTWRAMNSWCILKPEEYYFARAALRGGRTETRIFYHEGPYLDLDICSQYPSVQMKKAIEVCGKMVEILYPVGPPKIEIFDDDYYPCPWHYTDPTKKCSCDLSKKMQKKSKKLKVERVEGAEDLHEYVNHFFGVMMVDATPPRNLYHPVLPVFDEESGKCIQSLEPIVGKCFGSPELQLAVGMKYEITKIYRADRYTGAPSKWTESLGTFFTGKMLNSGEMIDDVEEQIRQQQYYHEEFGLNVDFSNRELWGNRPAAKKTFKILCNSGWGKHAETVDHSMAKVINSNDEAAEQLLFQSFADGMNEMMSFDFVGKDSTLVKYKAMRKGVKNPPNLTHGYLPAAVFVPMYGRMMLYNMLHKFGERVIMMDTDSIKVIAGDPREDAKLIKVGKYLGMWENESPNDQPVGFVCIAPKSYGQEYVSGKKNFKCKGVNLKRAHSNLINYDVAKEIYLNGKTVEVPQMVFGYKWGKGISKRNFIKEIKFDERGLKGILDRRTHQLYPFGWESSEV
jgi:hypothetical protein